MWKENEAILARRSDVAKKLLESRIATERDSCQNVSLGIKLEYLSYHHFTWQMLFLMANNS